MKQLLYCAFLLIPGLPGAADLLRVDFENRSTGVYTDAAAKEDFRVSTDKGQWFDGMDDGRAFIDADSAQGRFLRLTYPQGCYGTVDPHACAAQIKVYLKETHHDSLWLSFKVRFTENFEFVKGGKLPGLCGSQCKTGGNIPSGDDGWSARHMWRSGGDAVQYLYYYGQPGNYGQDVPFVNAGKTLAFVPGEWTQITQLVVLNSLDAQRQPRPDGRICSWFNGIQAACDSSYVLRTQDTMHIDKFYLSTFHGGDGLEWAPSKDVYADFDDFVVSTESLLAEPPSSVQHPWKPWQNTSLLRMQRMSQDGRLGVPYRGRHYTGDGRSLP